MEWEELYKGFIITKNKKSVEKYKNISDLKTYDDVKGFTEYAGVLKDDIILIDIDNLEQSEILMNIVEDLQLNCKVYKTTRGRHFLFKNKKIDKCYNHCKIACGLEADIKVGCNNSYEVVKFNGKERFIEWDKEENAEYDELPYWLKPLKTNKDFEGLKDGDGRNPSLFGYILVLQSNSFSKEQIKETAKIINKYVFKEPLPKKELETILRDEAFEKPNFYDNGKLDINAFAKFLIANEHICKIRRGKYTFLYIYKNGVYIDDNEEMESRMIDYIPNLLQAKRNEVLKMIKLLIKDESKLAKENYIAFKNGIYDLEKDELLEFNPDIIITNQIPWDYNDKADNERIKEIIGNWVSHDEKTILLLEECIGMCMYRSNTYGASFILLGDKDNGKSTFINMLKALLGEENCSAVSLQNIDKRFFSADIQGKLANLGDDIGDEYIAKTETFKKLVTGETVQLERKGQDAFNYNNYGKLIFSANNMPTIKDPTGAVVEKRIIFVPFKVTYMKGVKNRQLSAEFESNKDMMETLILLGIKGIKRVIANDEFTESEIAKKSKENYQFMNDPVARFIDEYGKNNIHFEDANKVLYEYKAFCDREESLSKSPQILNRGIKRILGYDKIQSKIKIDGKRKSVYWYGVRGTDECDVSKFVRKKS